MLCLGSVQGREEVDGPRQLQALREKQPDSMELPLVTRCSTGRRPQTLSRCLLSPPPLLIRVQTKSKTSRGHSELLRASLLCKLRTEEGKSNPLISPNQSKIMRNITDRLEFHDLEEALNHVLGLCLPKALVGIPHGVGG